MNPIYGILLIAAGSVGAASFYVPFKKVKLWAWESYWISQGVAAWLIAPLVFALFTVPSGTLMNILSESPSSAKWLAVLFGALWGVGGLTFGLSIRYLGVALGQSISLGFCAAFGTLIPPLVAGENLLGSSAGLLTLVGVAICIAGIAVIGYAGALKTKGMSEEERTAAIKEFALKKGLLIAVLAGVMSACMNFGIEAATPIAEVAATYGTNPLYVNNPSMIFILIGGFIMNFIYCVYLNIKNGTGKDYISVSPGILLNNIFFTFLAGLLWFLQFHFFGMGKSQLPPEMSMFAWSILMALNIALSNIWGIILKEWKGVSTKTMLVLIIGIVILILSTFVVSL
ncbi:MAG: L-rhamnose/proton symporter RhaT [Mariniphaga sp.]|nr:L-rhamnose/proton symporter RhaT [Mariniphaga sp.]MDD4227191.1 L-rhamnose/proton symporter RhaT [Mariniphaga sp.]